MAEAGFFERRRVNAPGLVVVIAMHAAVLTAVALSKMEVVHVDFGPTKVKLIPLDSPPPEQKADQQRTERLPASRDKPVRIVKIRIPAETNTDPGPAPSTAGVDEGSVIGDPPIPFDPPRPPVRIAAALDARAELQPPYPPSEERAGNEGVVVVRILIGTDGRVKAVEKVSAGSEAFFRATERQALRHWRFRPATVDGAPVESWQQLTVRFQMPA